MTSLAILGATSQIARDFIRQQKSATELFLFSRQPDAMDAWLAAEKLTVASSREYAALGREYYDAVINFVGAGDPARAAEMGAAIFDVTHRFDSLALEYLKDHPRTRYIFLSSGAAYGTQFLEPAAERTTATVPINNLSAQDFYSVAKIHAEARHRALADCAIVDIRVFNYFSRDTDLSKRFFVTDMLRAVRDAETFETGEQTMQRDFLVPQDFSALVGAVLKSAPRNLAVDAYSRAPIEKFVLLNAMKREFGLHYRTSPFPNMITATGIKPAYFSSSRKAAEFGYEPQFTSLEGVLVESRSLLQRLAVSDAP